MPPLVVDSLHDVHETASRRHTPRRNHLRRAYVEESPRPGRLVYRMENCVIQVDSIQPPGFPDIAPELARESGFLGVLDLLKVVKHGRSENFYLIRFRHVRPRARRKGQRKPG